ncbi:hypothetical protein CIRMBP1271_00392 [Enterococcus cecorum]|uniref:hypothetical protein n=1 Tax=Enterococcus cecorum TaxID=44008 RepID=UPI000657F046|nr:hypothetical protein [Enterococcus cecorum]KLO67549.1 hypothetical protein AA985_01225 [Enterococcus cecorum]CAI3257446.1 hypothetical protein CIRMBP1243_00107 [Enterococcus cecorum]CAI3258226.1 hypothetical protein CIRMBP1226_00121 [Enterococcus cecorum]CAI3258392.1 hypothetical protein CIRMBP1217_00094 [Enterococcus cecorum]CAI3258812.1 hypothetical protein CIRMBP1240_00122 [Enterococcus cecorum]
MAKLKWGEAGKRFYETGVSNGVLYVQQKGGTYGKGVAWNGLTQVSESPSGGEANPLYADNYKYLNLMSNEEFGATIEAYTYPDEWKQCDGSAELTTGVTIGQQERKTFGLCYKTIKGNDTEYNDFGYILHLIYGAKASPSEKSYASTNDSPEAITFSWEVTTTPVAVAGHKPTSVLTIDSSSIEPGKLKKLEDALFGTESTEPKLLLPDEVIALLAEE